MAAAVVTGGTVIEGTRAIPVLMARYNNSGSAPFPVTDLQTELFDGPWLPTGTMTQYYQEISYGRFTVTGTVFPWQQLPRDDTFYEGPDEPNGEPCNGVCNNAEMVAFVRDLLGLNDGAIDFSQYDNDGPDGTPNSGDDDGFVDFVAFVHPETGGECGNNNTNIWSHRWMLTGWPGGNEFETDDDANGGGKILIDDYVIMPALACDGTTMIEIGVFAHEFGHAFGLPDLYDTVNSNGRSAGIGLWGLMASGSWGGDGQSSERPTHMSAWSKEYLGWVVSQQASSDGGFQLSRIQDNPEALIVEIPSTNSYYLISNRQKVLFDENLPVGGLTIWRINDDVVIPGLQNNRVNADETNPGVKLIQADGKNNLDKAGESPPPQGNRGDDGDPYPGSSGNRQLDKNSNPKADASIAICGISDSGTSMSFNVSLNATEGCEDATDDNCSSAPLITDIWASPRGVVTLVLLLFPVLLAFGLLWGERRRSVRIA